MKVGLLWFDDDPRRSLEDKVLKAALRYRRKYGHSPNLCFVHPSVFSGGGDRRVRKAGGVEIHSRRSVLRDHFWLGVTDVTTESSRQNPLVQDGETERN
jgi:hypothetical protein